MSNNIKEDLKVFNELIEVFLEDEKLNPISENIKSSDIKEVLNIS